MAVTTIGLNHSSEPSLCIITYQPERRKGAFAGRVAGAHISVLQFKANGEGGTRRCQYLSEKMSSLELHQQLFFQSWTSIIKRA